MGRKTLRRLILDPAIDLSAADSVAAFKARVVMILVLAPPLALALSWGALAWAVTALVLEGEAQVCFSRALARGPLRRKDRLRVLQRDFWVTATWSSAQLALLFADGGRFLPAGLIWASGTLLYVAAFSFRAPAYALLSAAPPLTVFALAPLTMIGREPVAVISLLAAFLVVNVAFAAHAGVVSHHRERDLRRTRRKLLREAEAARHLAFHDQLTGLVNRRHLAEQMAQAVAHADRHGEELAALLIDLDRFKFVNDTYGHACGDDLLREVANRLTRSCRAGDICGRLGGDEFVVLARSCSAGDAATVAQRILKALAEPMHLSAATVHTGGSIGIGVYAGGQGADPNLMRQADLALYRVKERGRNGFCFFETEMDQVVQSRRGLEIDLRDALRAGQIGVVYQPQFEDAVMVGVEALARWTHPVRGPVGPDVFIHLAEECGLIEELGLYVMRRAFADAVRWPSLRVAVNLSPVQLRTPALLREVERLLATSGVEPRRIEFELTESVLLADDLQTQQTLATLRAQGFGVALDDFGAGYSSLSYLRKFPIDRVKIDRSFVASLPADKVSDAVVRAVVRLCRTLGVEVLAEGVETPAQQRALAAAGCRAVQGYLTGRPVPAEEIAAPPVTVAAG